MHLPQGSYFASNPIQVCKTLWHKVIVVPAITGSSSLPMGTKKNRPHSLESPLAPLCSVFSLLSFLIQFRTETSSRFLSPEKNQKILWKGRWEWGWGGGLSCGCGLQGN